ncbi:unnamed protein product [Allacma fusca]|uniref:Uncharacterized protein n=1 Tax=Allacma fusca TaxID=39272 RepID=A0A8J2KEK9_9HEXA|nr:unnamed protein product [Allacma fusca]
MLLNNEAEDILTIPDVVIPAWILEGENGTTKNMTIEAIAKYIDEQMDAQGNENHLIRGLVKLLMGMVQPNVDYRQNLNYYCYGNNEFGVFEDIYDILTDAALYLITIDMKKLVLDVYFQAYTKFFQPGKTKDELEQRKAIFQQMVTRIKRKIGFSYLDGSDYSELPHPPIFKCDKPPEEPNQVPSQWGRNITTGLSPAAGATYSYDPQAGPEKEDENVGYLDDRHPTLEYVQFSKSFHVS